MLSGVGAAREPQVVTAKGVTCRYRAIKGLQYLESCTPPNPTTPRLSACSLKVDLPESSSSFVMHCRYLEEIEGSLTSRLPRAL